MVCASMSASMSEGTYEREYLFMSASMSEGTYEREYLFMSASGVCEHECEYERGYL